MINIVMKEIEFDNELKKKIEFICDFCNIKPTLIKGNIRNISRSNLSYIEPHRIIIKGITFLAFNYSKTLYVVVLCQENGEVKFRVPWFSFIDPNLYLFLKSLSN